jgi:hypothetical protein
MTKKLDLLGILIYTGMAGAVVFIVVVLAFTVFKSMIFGA